MPRKGEGVGVGEARHLRVGEERHLRVGEERHLRVGEARYLRVGEEKHLRATGVVPVDKLQALVYDILPASTTAVFSYAIGSRKLSANEQFFVGAQRVVTLLQTTEIK